MGKADWLQVTPRTGLAQDALVYIESRAAQFRTTAPTGAPSVAKGNGAVVAAYRGGFRAYNCTFQENKASLGGGVIDAQDHSNVLLYNSILASNFGFKGGVVSVQTEATITIQNCQIKSNNGSRGGAFHLTNGGILNIQDSIIDSNRAIENGGAFWCSNSKVNLNNTVTIRNSVDGSVDAKDSTFFCSYVPAFTHCKIKADTTWNEYCPVPEYDEPSSNNAFGVPKGVAATVIVLPIVGIFVFIVCLAGGLFIIKKKRAGYVPMWARRLTSGNDGDATELAFQPDEEQEDDLDAFMEGIRKSRIKKKKSLFC